MGLHDLHHGLFELQFSLSPRDQPGVLVDLLQLTAGDEKQTDYELNIVITN